MKLTDEYIFKQPEKYQSILLQIISVINGNFTEMELLFKWGMPYFYHKKKLWMLVLLEDFS